MKLKEVLNDPRANLSPEARAAIEAKISAASKHKEEIEGFMRKAEEMRRSSN